MAFGTVRPLVGMDELAAARADAQRTYEADLAARQARLGSLFRQPSFPPPLLLASPERRRPLAVIGSNLTHVGETQRQLAGKAQVVAANGGQQLADGAQGFAAQQVAERLRGDRGKRPAEAKDRGHVEAGWRPSDRPRLASSNNGSARGGSSSNQQAVAMFF